MSGDEGRRPADDGPGEEDQDHKLQREREKASSDQHEDAAGPGYTARPSAEEPEEPGTPGAGTPGEGA